MAKRIADKELTDRNWDQEEEGEEAGTFLVASDDVLRNRAIKKAKRRNTGGETEGSGAFKGFKGFSLTTASGASALTTFSGYGNSGDVKGLGGLTNGNSSAPSFGGFSAAAATTAATTAAPGLMFNGPTISKPSADMTAKPSNGVRSSAAQSSASCGSSDEYNRQLTALNCSVRDWISRHVNDNPLCDLNPIFRDYERHLASIEHQYGAGSTEGASEEKKPATASPPSPPAASPSSSSSTPPSAALFSFSKSTTVDKSSTAGITFNFGQKVDSSVLASLGSKPTPSSFSFIPSSTSSSSLFGSAATPSFSGNKSEDTQAAADENEDDEEPPKPEVKEVKEKDAFYSKKCKLFYKKENEFKEKGVGTLHLKLMDNGKTQLIVRADTNLGNILLNIIIQESMPCSRLGKNNVMLVCVPNPPVDDKNPGSPVPLLVRVKSTEEADELHKILEEKKG